MGITKETVEHVARLARLTLTDDEVTALTRELSSILEWVTQLNEMDLSRVEGIHSLETAQTKFQQAILREDEADNSAVVDSVLAHAPHEEERYFRVPKILSD